MIGLFLSCIVFLGATVVLLDRVEAFRSAMSFLTIWYSFWFSYSLVRYACNWNRTQMVDPQGNPLRGKEAFKARLMYECITTVPFVLASIATILGAYCLLTAAQGVEAFSDFNALRCIAGAFLLFGGVWVNFQIWVTSCLSL